MLRKFAKKFMQDPNQNPDPKPTEEKDPDPDADPEKIILDPQHYFSLDGNGTCTANTGKLCSCRGHCTQQDVTSDVKEKKVKHS